MQHPGGHRPYRYNPDRDIYIQMPHPDTFADEGTRCTVELVMKECALQSRIYKYKKSVLCNAEFINIKKCAPQRRFYKYKKCAPQSRIYKYKSEFGNTEFMNIKLCPGIQS